MGKSQVKVSASVRKWQEDLLALLDAVEANLCPSAPKSARMALARMRSEVLRGKQKETERRVNALIEGKACLRAAMRRDIRSILVEVRTRAEQFLQELRPQLEVIAKSKECSGKRAPRMKVVGRRVRSERGQVAGFGPSRGKRRRSRRSE